MLRRSSQLPVDQPDWSNKIDAPSYFRNESDLEAYANGFLQTMIPTAISVATGDARADYMAWRVVMQCVEAKSRSSSTLRMTYSRESRGL